MRFKKIILNLSILAGVVSGFIIQKPTFAQESNTESELQSESKYRNSNPFNASVWAGVGFQSAARNNIDHFISQPSANYQLGIAKSFWNFNPNNFLYIAFIFNGSYSKKGQANDFKSWYYTFNEQLLLGAEGTLGTPYLSGFLEFGPVLQQRAFTIGQSATTAIDYAFFVPGGVSLNGGFNFKIVPERRVSYFFRLAFNLMIGSNRFKTLNYNGARINVNPVLYGPSLSFGVRM